MAIINFIPVCSACGAKINGTVSYERIPVVDIFILHDDVISPPYCSACGQSFTMIRIPTRLPYIGEEGENDE